MMCKWKFGFTVFFIFLLCNACDYKKNTLLNRNKPTTIRYINNPLDSELVIYTTGMPDYEYQEGSYYAAQKYGFRYWPAAGCIVSDSIISWSNSRNTLTRDKLSEIYGNDWEVSFNKEVEMIQTKLSHAKKIIQNYYLCRRMLLNDQYIDSDIVFYPHKTNSNLVHALLCTNLRWRKYTLIEYWILADIDIQNDAISTIKSMDSTEFVIRDLRN